jgi:Tfp pilus assembly PilM family ATPase
MPDYLALDLHQSQLVGVAAHVNPQRVRVQQCIALDWPDELDRWSLPAEAGLWLKEAIQREGISAREVLVSLPREEVVVRQIDVPDVPEEELPALVRMQAETRSTSSMNDMLLDFLPLPPAHDSTSRQVLIVTIAKQRLDRIRQLITAAELELSSVGISPVAASELVARAEAQLGTARDESTLVVSQSRQRVEISLTRDDHLIFSHSAQLAGHEAEADNLSTLAEVRRSLGALTRYDATLNVTRAWVVGTTEETESLRKILQERLDCAVSVLEPLSDVAIRCESAEMPANQAPLCGPIGMLLSTSKATVAIVDLLHPRKPVVRPDRRRLKIGLVAGAAVIALVVAYGTTLWQSRVIDRDIKSANETLAKLDELIKRAQPTVTIATAIDEWDQRDVDFLSQITHLNRMLPGTDRILLEQLRFNSLVGEEIAQIQADGLARTREDVESLYQRLADKKYRVRTHGIQSTDQDQDYPVRFMLDLGITPETETLSDASANDGAREVKSASSASREGRTR